MSKTQRQSNSTLPLSSCFFRQAPKDEGCRHQPVDSLVTRRLKSDVLYRHIPRVNRASQRVKHEEVQQQAKGDLGLSKLGLER